MHDLQDELSPPSVKQQLAAIRMLFDWLVAGHVIDTNPAHSVRGPRYTAKKGKTPVLTAEEAHALLESIPITKKSAIDTETADQLISSACATAPSLGPWSTASPGSAPSFR
jgi:site-specific recombinase XerC